MGAIDFQPRYPVYVPYQAADVPFTGSDPVMGTYLVLFTAAEHVDTFAALVDLPDGMLPVVLASRQALIDQLSDLNESVASDGAKIRYIVIDPVPDQMTTAYHIGMLIEYLQKQA